MTFDEAITRYPIMYFGEYSQNGHGRKIMAKHMKRAGYRRLSVRVLPWQRPTHFWVRNDWSMEHLIAAIACSAGCSYYSPTDGPFTPPPLPDCAQ
jgi:hypothetical protein